MQNFDEYGSNALGKSDSSIMVAVLLQCTDVSLENIIPNLDKFTLQFGQLGQLGHKLNKT